MPIRMSVQTDLSYWSCRTRTECLHVCLVNNRWRELCGLCVIPWQIALAGPAHLLLMSLSYALSTPLTINLHQLGRQQIDWPVWACVCERAWFMICLIVVLLRWVGLFRYTTLVIVVLCWCWALGHWIQPSYRHQSFVQLSSFFHPVLHFCTSAKYGRWKWWCVLKLWGCLFILTFIPFAFCDTDYYLWKRLHSWSVITSPPHHPPSSTSCHSSIPGFSASCISPFFFSQSCAHSAMSCAFAFLKKNFC